MQRTRATDKMSTPRFTTNVFMRLHILGIGGTFMAGLAALARSLGHDNSKPTVAQAYADDR